MNEVPPVLPYGPRILIHIPPQEERMLGSIALPATANPDSTLVLATVIRIGKWDKSTSPMELNAGDKVWVVKYDGHLLPDEYNEYMIIDWEKIKAKHYEKG